MPENNDKIHKAVAVWNPFQNTAPKNIQITLLKKNPCIVFHSSVFFILYTYIYGLR